MSTETKQLIKLILLYLLDSSEYPLSNSRLTEFLVERGYAPYFPMQQALSELVEDEYVSFDKTRNTTRYQITPQGSQTLSLFLKDISPAILTDIREYLKENNINLREDCSYPATIIPLEGGEYSVRLRILERGEPIFETKLVVPTKELSERICRNWDKKNDKVYSTIVELLFSE